MYRIFQDELSSEKTINVLIIIRNVNNYDYRCDSISNRCKRKEMYHSLSNFSLLFKQALTVDWLSQEYIENNFTY